MHIQVTFIDNILSVLFNMKRFFVMDKNLGLHYTTSSILQCKHSLFCIKMLQVPVIYRASVMRQSPIRMRRAINTITCISKYDI